MFKFMANKTQKKKASKAPSAKQLTARRKFALAAKAKKRNSSVAGRFKTQAEQQAALFNQMANWRKGVGNSSE